MPLIRSFNAILLTSAQMPHHTDVGRVFAALGGAPQRYNWLLTDNGDRPKWFSGNELARIVEEENLVFDWAVLSGFAPDVSVDLSTDPVPYADGNRELWKPYPKPQHPKATVEIVCFDSSLTLLLSREPELTSRFRGFFTDSLDFDRYIDDHIRPVLLAWQAAARSAPIGTVLTVPVISVGQTMAVVEVAQGVEATLSVKQMRAARFGPTHWLALDEYIKPGQRMMVRVVEMDAEERAVVVEFLGVEALDGSVGTASPADRVSCPDKADG